LLVNGVGLESIEQFKETVQGESEPDTSRESMESRDDRDHREEGDRSEGEEQSDLGDKQ
jgi:hypothetical protein